MIFSVSIVVFLLASSVSALVTPHGLHARDTSLGARHHHIARQANKHSVVRRLARRKRCLEKTALGSSSSSSPAAVTTTSSIAVLDVPVNVAPEAATTTTTPAPAVQPTTTTTSDAVPQPSTTYVEAPSTGSGQTHSGDGTFFDVGLGACGQTSVSSDYMVAIGWELFDSFATGPSLVNPNLNPVCGKQIRASYGGKSVTVTVLDRCGGCQPDDLDFSPSAFSQLADFSLGRLKNVEWQFI